MDKGRHIGLDLLRILSALGVVFIHVAAPFVTQNMKLGNEAFWAGNLFDTLGRFSVPVFVIVSGFFILKPIPDLGAFYRKRFIRILLPFVCWSVVYLLWSILFEHTHSRRIWDGVLWGKPYFHLWFLGMLMGLYAVTPLLGTLLDRIGARRFAYVALGAFILAMGMDAWDTYMHNKPWIGVWWVSYVGYFMVGACMRSFKGMLNSKLLMAEVAVLCYMMVFVFTGLLFKNGHYSWYFYGYLSITSIVGSIALANLFRGMELPANRIVVELSDLTFGIYLIHMIPLTIIRRYWHLRIVDDTFLNILLISLIVFAASAIAVWPMSKVKIIKRLML